ncbi:MAG: 1-acyl-sn-glycerol-3-phosphate acyltransferase [Alphaproteobacteria bacterium]|nr:1-acyl-sn-glycerol-3-phosphate acyltransferase [Alphaproteobacteria bacterium]
MQIFYLFRSLVFSIFFSVTTVLVSILFSPFLLFRCKALYWAGIIWCKISLFFLKVICGIDYKVEGRKNLPSEPFIIASKHQSAFETVAFWDIFYIPTYVLKRELTKIPFFGIYLVRMKMICISRAAGASALKQIVKEAEYHLKENRHIIIYPEGTRTAPGRKTERYHPGVVALYNNCNVPIVPVALNSGKYWQNGKWTKLPGTVTVKILPPILPGLDKKAFLKKLNSQIEDTSSSL